MSFCFPYFYDFYSTSQAITTQSKNYNKNNLTQYGTIVPWVQNNPKPLSEFQLWKKSFQDQNQPIVQLSLGSYNPQEI